MISFWIADRARRSCHCRWCRRRRRCRSRVVPVPAAAGFFQVQLHRLRARRQRGLHPRLARQARAHSRCAPAGRRRSHCAGCWCWCTGDRGDDHRAIRHQCLRSASRPRIAAMPRSASRWSATRLCGFDGPAMLRTTVDRSKCRRALVLRGRERIGPQAGLLRVGFDQHHLRVARGRSGAGSRWCCWSMKNIAAVAPYSGAMFEIVARSPSVSAAAPSPRNSR
jgi:hypothetical protein